MDLKRLHLIGFEPITIGTEIQHSIQLSYKCILRILNFKKIMIQQKTIIKVSDNSGAKTVKCIKVLGGFKKQYGKLGDTIIVSVKTLRNKLKKQSKITKKKIYKALIIRTKINIPKKTGVYTKFYRNSVALQHQQNNPISTRILGPLSKSLKFKTNQKFISISSRLI